MRIELWQVPLLVVAGIVVVDFVARAVVERMKLSTVRRKQLKLGVLGILALIMGALLWGAWSLIGTSTLADIAAIVAMLIEFVALWLAYQAYRETKGHVDGQDQGGSDVGGAPEVPAREVRAGGGRET